MVNKTSSVKLFPFKCKPEHFIVGTKKVSVPFPNIGLKGACSVRVAYLKE